MKLPSQFAALAPKVREFLETQAFGEPVDLDDPVIIKAISTNVAQYVTVQTFVKALRPLVVQELEPQLIDAAPTVRDPAVPVLAPHAAARKTVFNLVPCENEFERRLPSSWKTRPTWPVCQAAGAIRLCHRVHGREQQSALLRTRFCRRDRNGVHT